MNNVIVVAGGKGLRMGSDLPKQFIPINGVPVLMRTIKAFYDFDNFIKIIVVLAPYYRDYWAYLCKQYSFSIPHIITEGGETRFHSVKNGLDFVDKGLVAVHDAARPFVSKDLIKTIFDAAHKQLAVIPVTSVTDSLRLLTDDSSSKIVDRSIYRLVQTPQVFEVGLLKKAYNIDFKAEFTDDASVVEYMGQQIHLVEGERTNIKITTPFDLDLAQVIVDK